MDAFRFDTLVRTLLISRRGALKTLLGGAAAMPMAREHVATVAALPKPAGFERLGKRCDQGQPCGIYVPCTFGFCTPDKCWINNTVVDDHAPNPDNPCQRCVALEHKHAWARWSDVRDGTTCPPDPAGNPCLSTFIAHCQDGICVTEPLPDGTECGPDQVCCDGVCSPPDACCPAGQRHGREACEPGCSIAGTDYALGDFNSENFCQWCDPAVSATAWSPVPPNYACDASGLTVCCDGACCPQFTICRAGEGGVFCGA